MPFYWHEGFREGHPWHHLSNTFPIALGYGFSNVLMLLCKVLRPSLLASSVPNEFWRVTLRRILRLLQSILEVERKAVFNDTYFARYRAVGEDDICGIGKRGGAFQRHGGFVRKN